MIKITHNSIRRYINLINLETCFHLVLCPDIIFQNTEKKGKLLPKNEDTSGGKAHTNTWKYN